MGNHGQVLTDVLNLTLDKNKKSSVMEDFDIMN